MSNKQIEELVDLMFDTDMEELMKEKSTLEYIYKLQQENKQLKENYQFKLEENSKLSELWCKSQQENKQLKGILQEIYERAININITPLDFRDYILEILGDKENE